MHIRRGFDIVYDCPAPTPMLLMLSLRPERTVDLVTPQVIAVDPPVPARDYLDGFGNRCTRLLALQGPIRFSADFVVAYTGQPDEIAVDAAQHPVGDLPNDVLMFLLGSRYCETDRLMDIAWSQFGHLAPGWGRGFTVPQFTWPGCSSITPNWPLMLRMKSWAREIPAPSPRRNPRRGSLK